MGEMNRIPARTTGDGIETPFGPLAMAAPVTGDLVLCLRPEAILQGEGTAGTLDMGRAEVLDVAFFGTHCRAHLRPEAAPDLVLVAHLPPADPPEAGKHLTLSAQAKDLTLYPKEA
jgi:spermidine/putrescine transport system ATP-binding protein